MVPQLYAKYKKKTNEAILRKMVSYKIDGRTDRPKFIGSSQKRGSNKLDHYGIRGISNKWLASYLTERNQFVSINGFNLALADNIYAVPQGSLLGLLK